MKPAPFAYLRPRTLEEALEALAADDGAKVLAGGQSLVPLLSMRLAAPSRLVDVNALPGLAEVTVTGADVRIGALARHASVLADEAAAEAQPLLRTALRHVAHATIRNRGTTVGSLVHADAAAEMPAVLCLLGGAVEVVSASGPRTIPAAELYLGPLESSLRHDELAVAASFPRLAPGEGMAFDEVARRHGDYAVCGVAALVEVQDDRVTAARAAYLSVNDVPTVVDLGATLVDGPTDAALAAAGEEALRHLEPMADLHASADYRAHLVRVLTARVLRAAEEHARKRQVVAA